METNFTQTQNMTMCLQTPQAKKKERSIEEDVTAYTSPRYDIVVGSRINTLYIHLLTLWFHLFDFRSWWWEGCVLSVYQQSIIGRDRGLVARLHEDFDCFFLI
jgi:hypothetical protein